MHMMVAYKVVSVLPPLGSRIQHLRLGVRRKWGRQAGYHYRSCTESTLGI